MKYKIAIGNMIDVDVVGKLDDGGTQKNFKFKLKCERLSQDEMTKRIENKDESIKDFIESVTSGWADQRLILNDDDTPADYSPDALGALMSIAGMPMFLYQSYLKSVAVKEKN